MSSIRKGSIQFRERARQQYDYSGLLYGNGITPTDLDGLLEFGDQVFILLELKYHNAPASIGQTLALQRTVDALAVAGKQAICLMAEHNTPTHIDVDAAVCLITLYRYQEAWHRPRQPTTVRQAIDLFLEQHAPKYLEN